MTARAGAVSGPCGGIADQAGNPGAPQNKPEALRTLLQFWRGNHPPGTVQHAQPAVSVVKNAGSAALSVTRAGGSTGPASMHYSTSGGDALPGTDYTVASGQLDWADGDTAPKTITVPLLNPAAITAGRTFNVTLANPQYAATGSPATVTVSIQEPPFQSWLFGYFGANANGVSGPASDSDNDGFTNLMEYVLNSDPTAYAQQPQPAAGSEGGNLVFIFDRRLNTPEQSGITVRVEWSTDLAGPWSSAGVTEELLSVNGETGHIKAIVPANGNRRLFARLHASLP